MKMKAESKSLSLSKRKQQLHRQSDRYKTALSTDLQDMKVDLSKLGKDFLIIGGSLYVAYKVFKLFRGSEDIGVEAINAETKAVVVTKEPSVIVSKIKEQITLFLLALAVKKLKEYINKQTDE